MKIIIVGGVAGGATAAARIRRLDEEAEILLVEKGAHLSYANCGLPYYVGGAIARRDALFVSSKESIEGKYGIDVRDVSLVTAVDPDAHTVSIKNLRTDEVYTESYDKLILATGSSPFIPPMEGRTADTVFSLWTVPDTDRIKEYIERRKPQRAVVVGAGFIGLEMVENLHDLGLEVTLVEKTDQTMPPFDRGMAKLIENHLVEKGVGLRLGVGVTAVTDRGHTVQLDDGSSIETDMVLLSVGVRPNSELAREAGLELGPRGHVLVDQTMRTSAEDIYAVGDVTEGLEPMFGGTHAVPLAGPANRQGRAVAAAVLGQEPEIYEGTIGTSVAKVFDITAASTGWSEKALRREGKVYGTDFHVALVHPMNHAGYYPGATPMTLKLVFASDGKVLGAQAVGYEGVDKRIDTIASTIHFGGSVNDLTNLELAYAPPYSSAKDPVNFAGYVAQDILAGLTNPVLFREWRDQRNDDDAWQLLDVREDPEVATGMMPDAIHIPLSHLRERVGELDSSKKYLVYCAVGLRGYVAERILKQHGLKAGNFQGGFRTWRDMEASIDHPIPVRTHKANTESTRLYDPAAGGDDRPVGTIVPLDVCGMACPGPIVEVAKAIKDLPEGDALEVVATDPGFAKDIVAWADNTGNTLVDSGSGAGRYTAVIRKGAPKAAAAPSAPTQREKTMIVFDGDLDKAIAAFIIANGAAAMGDQVNMFFTFWGLSVIRKEERSRTPKDAVSRAFSEMLPRGAAKLGLSKMNVGGAGGQMMRRVMKAKGVSSLEELIAQAQESGVKLTACQMTMDIMGISADELIDGVEIGGVATMLADNDRSNMNLFI